MRRMIGIALITSAAVLVVAAYAGSSAAGSAEAAQPTPTASAPAPVAPKAPEIRIIRAPDSEQQPQTPASRPTAASQPGGAGPDITLVTTQASPATAVFERLKALEGTWELEQPPLATTDGVAEFRTVFHVTSAGRTVIETDFPNTKRENVTVYHIDGDGLMLTHYCPLGSQPRMRATRFDEPQRIAFIFHDSTNLDMSKDRHCHNLTFTFMDEDHFQQDWTFYVKGEQRHIKSFNWKRVKN